MNRTATIVVAAATVFALILSVLNRSDRPERDTSVEQGSQGMQGYATNPTAGGSGSGSESTESEAVPPDTTGENALTTEQFRQLSREEQDVALSEYVTAFWTTETGAPGREHEKDYVPLEIFARPYMVTVAERDFRDLAPEDQQKVVDETMESLRGRRSHALNTVALARERAANGSYIEAEAYLISVLETGRELNGNKEGILLVRLVGMAHQKAALDEMVRLYAKTSQSPKLSMAREELQSLEDEIEEMRKIPPPGSDDG